jgi:dihydroorotate dehydrogenase electron transfer subunit
VTAGACEHEHDAHVHWADHAWHGPVTVVENVRLARDTYRVRVEAAEAARRIVPGQFVMLRWAGANDPLLGRPLALYDVVTDASGQPSAIDVVYLVVGKMTSRLAAIHAGQKLEMWGPLGNGFQPRQVDHLIMVAGGIGQTPFLALGQEYLGRRFPRGPQQDSLPPAPWAKRVTLCYGARTADYLAGVEDFRRAGFDVQISTDDGSAGRKGLVTGLLEDALDRSGSERCHVACCGPEPMMHAVAQVAARRGVSCEVSLETPMACGIGICFSCVAKVRTEDGWDYRRTCVEGPVFEAERIEF